MKDQSGLALAVAVSVMLSAGASLAQAPDHAVGRNLTEMNFVALPGLPGCALNAVQSGDPAKGPSIILAKIASGCTVPWHWHTPNEHLMMVSGTARVEPREGKAIVLKEGGFAHLPPRHVHQFTCLSDCVMYVQADGPFDIHYVDAQGKEIAPEAALKAVQSAQRR